MKKFNWINSFEKTYNKPGKKIIVKCAVCGNMTYMCSDDLEASGFKKLEADDRYICPNCLEKHYISKAAADIADKEYYELNGSVDAEVFDEPFIFSRDQYTWDEAQEIIKDYNSALKDFLIDKDPDLVNIYNDYFK